MSSSIINEEDLVETWIKEEAAKVPAEDRLLTIKVLEGEQDYNYTLESGAWIRLNGFRIEYPQPNAVALRATRICDAATRSMCVVGAIIVAKLPSTVTAEEVDYYSSLYTEQTGLIYSHLDYIIDFDGIPAFIEELRRLEVEG